jgi:hypothetical protein
LNQKESFGLPAGRTRRCERALLLEGLVLPTIAE